METFSQVVSTGTESTEFEERDILAPFIEPVESRTFWDTGYTRLYSRDALSNSTGSYFFEYERELMPKVHDLSCLICEVTSCIVKMEGGREVPVTKADNVSVTNNYVDSLWNRIQMNINNSEAYASPANRYHYVQLSRLLGHEQPLEGKGLDMLALNQAEEHPGNTNVSVNLGFTRRANQFVHLKRDNNDRYQRDYDAERLKNRSTPKSRVMAEFLAKEAERRKSASGAKKRKNRDQILGVAQGIAKGIKRRRIDGGGSEVVSTGNAPSTGGDGGQTVSETGGAQEGDREEVEVEEEEEEDKGSEDGGGGGLDLGGEVTPTDDYSSYGDDLSVGDDPDSSGDEEDDDPTLREVPKRVYHIGTLTYGFNTTKQFLPWNCSLQIQLDKESDEHLLHVRSDSTYEAKKYKIKILHVGLYLRYYIIHDRLYAHFKNVYASGMRSKMYFFKPYTHSNLMEVGTRHFSKDIGFRGRKLVKLFVVFMNQQRHNGNREYCSGVYMQPPELLTATLKQADRDPLQLAPALMRTPSTSLLQKLYFDYLVNTQVFGAETPRNTISFEKFKTNAFVMTLNCVASGTLQTDQLPLIKQGPVHLDLLLREPLKEALYVFYMGYTVSVLSVAPGQPVLLSDELSYERN